MLAAPWSEPIREPEEVFFVDCVEHFHHRTLNDLIFQCTDGEFILHLLQEPFRIGSILIRLERAIQAFNCVSLSGVMVIQ